MATITHYVDRDARIANGLGAGACDHLDVGYWDGYTYLTWLAFIGESWAGIPSAAAITSAVLKVYTGSQYHTGRTAGTMRVRRTTTPGTVFSEGTASHPMSASNAITTDNDPASTDTDAGTGTISDSNGWKSITITNIAKAYYGLSNYAVRLSADSGVYEFWSREYGSTYDAKIEITYNPNSAPTAPTSLTAAGEASGSTIDDTTPDLQFTHNDPDADAPVRWDIQVKATTGNGVDPGFPTPDATTGLAAYTYNNTSDLTNPIVWTCSTTLSRGQWYAWRVRTADATNGDGAWSVVQYFFIGSQPTATGLIPSSGTIGPLYYDAGSNTTPKILAAYTFTCADGHTQASSIVRIYNDSGGTKGTLAHTHNITGTQRTAIQISGFAPSRATYYWISVQTTCSGGIQGVESTAVRFKVEWLRASYRYNMGATPPNGWGSPTVTSTGSMNVMEWASSTTTTEPTTWYDSLADVPLPSGAANYVWFRVTQFSQANVASPTKPTVADVTPRWTSASLVADNWTYTAGQFVIDPASEKFGTQSLKGINAASATRIATQRVPVRPGTDYILSGYIKSQGNSGALIRVTEVDGSATISEGTLQTTTHDFARVSNAVFNSGTRDEVLVVCRINGATGTYAWFDALKLEASTVVTPWTPGFIGEGTAIDAGGVQVDASAGGVFRLRGASGGDRDLVELGNNGLLLGGDVNVYSSGAGLVDLPAIRLSTTTDAALASTGHAFQIGPSSGANLIADVNEIIARSNGVEAQLHLNAEGGGVTIANSASPTAAADGITFGTDVTLYRSAANVLKTDDDFRSASRVFAGKAYAMETPGGTETTNVTANTDAALNLGTADTGSVGTVSGSTWTVPTGGDGFWLIHAWCRTDQGTGGDSRYFCITVNSTSVGTGAIGSGYIVLPSTNTNTYTTVTALTSLAAGDVIRVLFRPLTTNGDGQLYRLSAVRLADAMG